MQDYFENAEPRMIAMMLIGIIFLVAAVEITYLLWPQVKNFRQLHASHQVLKQAVTSDDSLSNQLRKIDAEVQDLSRELHGDMARLPARQMESFVIGRLQKVSWATEVELLSVQPGSGRQVQNFRESLFEVKLNARYHDFFEWLQTVNDELGYIVVKKFEIRPDEHDKLDNPVLSLVLTLVSYRMELENAS
ncbi:MAG: type 4a pilus biogenesis protein PilO [Gammaproteobacteria bacterium]|nr:type 4a pilus biogenesis protein PilO [Gammaproteobacteria bacterium]